MAERVASIQATLAEQAGNNSLEDRFHCGYIAAFNDVIKVEPEFTEESE